MIIHESESETAIIHEGESESSEAATVPHTNNVEVVSEIESDTVLIHESESKTMIICESERESSAKNLFQLF